MRRAAALLLLLPLAAGAEGRVEARDGWIRLAPPGAMAMAGYLTLRNAGTQALRCEAVSAADFGAAELHRTVVEDGMSRMLRGQVVELPAGGEARLAPGGLHIMLFRPQRPLPAGTRSTVTLHCGGIDIASELVVREAE